MKKIRGFALKHRIKVLFRRLCRRNHLSTGYRRLDESPAWKDRPIRKLISWGSCLKNKAKAICSKNSCPGYEQIGQLPNREKPTEVPKGHLAVYVGQKDSDFQRVLVPVIYFNHPLFGELLRESEEEYGFNHPGGITIPCRISEFESVWTRIKKGGRRSTISREVLTSRRSSN